MAIIDQFEVQDVEDDSTLTRVDEDLCEECEGYGEVPTGRIEHDTGAAITVKCSECQGFGYFSVLNRVGSEEFILYNLIQSDLYPRRIDGVED